MMTAVGLDDLPAKWPERIVPLGKGEAPARRGGRRWTWA